MREVADIIWYDTLESTNSEARRHISDVDKMSVTAAVCQTAGRGQGDHSWTSDAGANLTFSVTLKPRDLAARDALMLTQATTHAISRYLALKGITTRIKWPNDVYVGEHKICGILIENILSGKDIAASIIGIGLNVNQVSFPADLPNPISIAALTGRSYDIRAELESLVSEISESVRLLDSQDGRTMLDDWFFSVAFNIPEGLR